MAGSYLRRQRHERHDHARRHVEYATVRATLANWTDGAILLTGDHLPMETWIPRYALEPLSRAQIYKKLRGDQVELQIELKMAQEKGLV